MDAGGRAVPPDPSLATWGLPPPDPRDAGGGFRPPGPSPSVVVVYWGPQGSQWPDYGPVKKSHFARIRAQNEISLEKLDF